MFTFARIISSILLSSLASGLVIPKLERRIVGGSVISGNAAPFAVHLTLTSSEGSVRYCEGTLISNRHVLTANSCVYQDNGKFYAPSNVKVGYGSTKLSEQLSTPAVNLYAQPKMDIVTTTFADQYANNLAVVEIQPVQTGELIAPVEIYTGSIQDNAQLIAVGWSIQTKDKDASADDLKAAKLRVGEQTKCLMYDPLYIGASGPRICTFAMTASDSATCKSNLGSGALMVVDGNLYLAGVNGLANGSGCGDSAGFTQFTHVNNYQEFLSQFLATLNNSV
ncbi:hypothetical protein EV183_001021 [Coemansia sp. RSA 2336]|nr:hypothetical protein EV183_001021 [Coemansia sp. RSA 2336]